MMMSVETLEARPSYLVFLALQPRVGRLDPRLQR